MLVLVRCLLRQSVKSCRLINLDVGFYVSGSVIKAAVADLSGGEIVVYGKGSCSV